ncbi:MAG: hypothetical protein A2V83_00540 [Nitrospirae bacterium RBG_16_64_22]|nr:MAG: hypothetical protein A2V83_00540 [Nitrospirae bacterium RBG_16_64_22]
MNDRSAWYEQLKTERERRGLSLMDISDRTRIRVVYLEILESGEIHKLPGEVFVRGFARAYASALGMDFRSIQGDLKGDLEAVFRGGSAGRSSEEGWEYKDPWWKALLRMPRWLGGLFLSGVGFLVFLYTVGLTVGPDAPRQVSRDPVPVPAVTAGVPVIGPRTVELKAYPVSSAGQNAVPAGRPPETVSLVLKAVEDTWLMVRVDNQASREVLLKRGESIRWDAREKVLLTLGNAGGVRVTFQDRSIEPLGRLGEVKKGILFTREIDRPQFVPEDGGGQGTSG